MNCNPLYFHPCNPALFYKPLLLFFSTESFLSNLVVYLVALSEHNFVISAGVSLLNLSKQTPSEVRYVSRMYNLFHRYNSTI